MAKTRRKNIRSPVKGRKSNATIMKKSPVISHKRGAKSRIPKSKNKNITTMLYESPLKHLQHNGEQSTAQSQLEDSKANEHENLPEQNEIKTEVHPKSEKECESVVNNSEKEIESATKVSSKSKRDATATSEESDVSVPVKKRKLNKSPLSRFNEIDQPTSTKILNLIDESVICVDDIDPTDGDSVKPQVTSEDIVVIDCNETLTSSETFNQADNQNANPVHNLTDSIIVLDDDPQPSTSKIVTKPTEDCMVVWSSLPTTSATLQSTSTSLKQKENFDVLKLDKISLDTRGEFSNLRYLRHDASNKKLAKKSPKVTKFGVKKLNTKKVSEITKGLAKSKIGTKVAPKVTVAKTPVKKKNKGDLIFSATPTESKSKSANDSKPKKGTLREIVIDGSNVAMAYTNNKVFSEKGIKMLIDYFSKKGHTVKVFIPQYRRARHYPLLEKWHDEGIVVFTPSRKVGNKCITSYDDRFIIEYATTCKGIVVSQDQFRDLYAEKAEYKDTIENRLLVPTFVGDYVMFPEDPLGRNGPSLAEFLKH